VLVKSLSGGPDGFDGPFTIKYVCSLDGSPDVTDSPMIAAGESATITGLPTGYECVVSEPALPEPPTGYSFAEPTFDPTDATVTITKNQASSVTTSNTLTRDLGQLRITKNLAGTPDGYSPTFEISYVCTLIGAEDISGSVTLTNGETVEVPSDGIPTGSECTVTEGALPTLPVNYGWNAPIYSNNQGNIPSNVVTIVTNSAFDSDQELVVDQMASVTVANSANFTPPFVPPPTTPESGSMSVTKTVLGGPDGFTAAFPILYTCSAGASSLTGTLTLFAGGSTTVGNIPVGYSCTVTEGELPPAPDGYSWFAPVITGSPTAVITNASTVNVTVTNSLLANVVNISVPELGTGEPEEVIPVIEPEAGLAPFSIPAGGGALGGLTKAVPVWLLLLFALSLVAALGGVAFERRTRKN